MKVFPSLIQTEHSTIDLNILDKILDQSDLTKISKECFKQKHTQDTKKKRRKPLRSEEKLMKNNPDIVKMIKEHKSVLEYMVQEVTELRNEIRELKSQVSRNNEKIVDICSLTNNSPESNIKNDAEKSKLHEIRNILKLEKEVHKIENSHLSSRMSKYLDLEEMEEKERRKMIESLSNNHQREIQQVQNYHSSNLSVYTVRIKKLEHASELQKEVHQSKVDSLKGEIMCLKESRRNDLNLIYDSLNLMLKKEINTEDNRLSRLSFLLQDVLAV